MLTALYYYPVVAFIPWVIFFVVHIKKCFNRFASTVKTIKIRITVVYPDKAASFIDRDTKHSVRRGGCRARKRIIYGNF